ncbi:HGxxPAAW family protein [Streptomyces sp. NPDC003456]|uniref:HGxxPAAW family protein n=1 Tax=Streptomyces sp. NPDC003456 TaxID=3364683 RepID=UPI0036D0BD24
MSAHQYDHGHTAAGWVGCGIASAGATVAGAGVCTGSGLLISAGLAVGVVALLVTWALHLGGWGKGPGARPREEWAWRVRDSAAPGGHADCLGCRLAGRGRRRVEHAGRETGAVPAGRGPAEPETALVGAAGTDTAS